MGCLDVYYTKEDALVWHNKDTSFFVGVGSYQEVYKIRDGKLKLMGWTHI